MFKQNALQTTNTNCLKLIHARKQTSEVISNQRLTRYQSCEAIIRQRWVMLENLTYQSTWSVRRWGTLRGIHHAKNHFSCPGSLTEKLACHKSPLITPTIPSSPSLSERVQRASGKGKKIIILLHIGWSEGWRQWQSPKSNRSQL